jgi:type IV secretory pathway VirB10-like protein
VRRKNHSDDLDFTTPSARASERRRSRGFVARLVRPIRTVSARGVVIGAVALICVGGLANALFLQERPHPAPLFGEAKPAATALPKISPVVPPARPKLAAATQPEKPAPPAAQPAAAPAKPAATPPAPARGAAPVPPLPVPTHSQRPASDDIGSLIRNASHPSPAAPANQPAAAAQPAPQQVMIVQRALLMRGFDVGKPDGRLGKATREAIQKVERQMGIPVTGQITPRLMRALGVQTASAAR